MLRIRSATIMVSLFVAACGPDRAGGGFDASTTDVRLDATADSTVDARADVRDVAVADRVDAQIDSGSCTGRSCATNLDCQNICGTAPAGSSYCCSFGTCYTSTQSSCPGTMVDGGGTDTGLSFDGFSFDIGTLCAMLCTTNADCTPCPGTTCRMPFPGVSVCM